MGINYAGGTNIFKGFSGATKNAIVDGLKGALVSAGWGIVSGGSGDWTLSTAVTPQGLSVPARIYNPGSGAGTVCARVAFNFPLSKEWYLFPGSNYRVICNRYQFFVFQNGVFTTLGTFVAGGVPYLDPFLVGAITSEAWAMGNCYFDGDAGTVGSPPITWRTSDSCYIQGFAEQYSSGRSHVNGNPGTANLNALRLMLKIAATPEAQGTQSGRRWDNDEAIKEGSRFAFGIINEDRPRIRGGLWDAVTVMEAHPADIFTDFDGKVWMNIMHNYNGGIGQASLWLAVPSETPT